jgi:hypothetical protein
MFPHQLRLGINRTINVITGTNVLVASYKLRNNVLGLGVYSAFTTARCASDGVK